MKEERRRCSKRDRRPPNKYGWYGMRMLNAARNQIAKNASMCSQPEPDIRYICTT